MSKPEDIPQDVWDVALRVWAELLTADHVGDPEVAHRDVDEIARAILAAKAEEREACLVAIRALHADAWGITEEQSALEDAIAALQRRGAAITAIRKRGEPL